MLGDEWKEPLKASKDILTYLGKSLGKETGPNEIKIKKKIKGKCVVTGKVTQFPRISFEMLYPPNADNV